MMRLHDRNFGISKICRTLLAIAATYLSSGEVLAVVNAQIKPWLRLESGMSHSQISPDGRRIAFIDSATGVLGLLDTRTQAVTEISKYSVGASFVFAPDGCRLFYRELARDSQNKEAFSKLRGYDCALKRSVDIKRIEGMTGFLAFDPKTQELQALGEEGKIFRQKLQYPDHKLSKWLRTQTTQAGQWIPTPKQMLWLRKGSHILEAVPGNDGSEILSYSISPDGRSCAWASKSGHVFLSEDGKKALDIGEGRDPQWHPKQKQIVYSSPRKAAAVVTDFDLRLADSRGAGEFLTRTQEGRERWPIWDPNSNRILFTQENSTDLFSLQFEEK